MNFRMGQVGWLALAIGCTGVALFGAEGCTITTTDDSDAAVTDLSACYGCLFDQCSGQWASCQSDTECAAIYTCATRPSCAADANCVQACYSAHPAGQKIYYSLAFCDLAGTCTTCSTTCSAIRSEAACVSPPQPDGGATGGNTGDGSTDGDTTDGGTTDSGTSDGGTSGGTTGTTGDASVPDPTVPPAQLACSVCTQQLCGPQKAACGAGTDCDKYQECVTYCSTRPDADIPPCLDDCEAGFSEGKAAADALGKCNTEQCGVICGYRGN